jgi:DNA-binding LacI/PurR family transcriptional regulator
MHDVAQAAGVSIATVSNVLRGARYVGPEPKKRVQDAIAALNYRPNSLAAGLRERRSPTQHSQVSCRLMVRESTAPYRTPRASEVVPALATPRTQ